MDHDDAAGRDAAGAQEKKVAGALVEVKQEKSGMD